MSTHIRPYLSNKPDGYIWRLIFLSLVGVSVVFALINLWQSWQGVNQPYPGFLHRNRVVVASNLSTGEAAKQGIQRGDVILAVDDMIIDGPSLFLLKNLRNHTYLVQKPTGEERLIGLPVVTFTVRDFIQWVFIPIFIALIVLIIVVVLSYTLAHLPAVRVFNVFVLALVYTIISLPEFTTQTLFLVTFYAGLISGILIPPLFLHFLIRYFASNKALKKRPFLLPFIYILVLPGLVHSTTLLHDPEALRSFLQIINLYNAAYTLAGFSWLYYIAWQGDSPIQKRAIVLLIGFILPISLFVLNGIITSFVPFTTLTPAYEMAERYIFWSIPIAAALAIIRYDLFGIRRVSHKHILFTTTVVGLLAVALLLSGTASSTPVGFSRLTLGGYEAIISTIIAFFVFRFLGKRTYRWWLSRRPHYRLEDFRTNVRILSRELLKVKSRRELDMLVSWNLATDFNLQAAEISTRDVAGIPYALRLPLEMNNVILGTLFLGPKLNGDTFSKQEQAIFVEAQQQIALVLLSLELDEAIQVMEELTRLKSKFLANVTHELRTPLNGIINYIGFVLDDAVQLNKEQKTYLNQALGAAERLLELINNILDMSKIEAGQMTLLKGQVNLNRLVTEVMPVVSELIGSKSVNLVTDVAPTLPIIFADRLRLRQIMLNLLSNAIKFTQDGSIKFAVYPDNGDVIIKVADTGLGIADEMLPTIFQQFTTDNLTDKMENLGPGLGMPITKSLVELHQGAIDVESQISVGTTVTISLPVDQVNES